MEMLLTEKKEDALSIIDQSFFLLNPLRSTIAFH